MKSILLGAVLLAGVAIAGPGGTMTPTLTGAQPSVYTHGGKTVRVLAQENDTAFALLDALDEKQKKQAILNYEVNDLVLGPGQSGKQIQPEGLKASEMSAKQRSMLLNVISQWAGIVNDAYARPRMTEIEADLNDTYFAWSGPVTHTPGRNGSSKGNFMTRMRSPDRWSAALAEISSGRIAQASKFRHGVPLAAE